MPEWTNLEIDLLRSAYGAANLRSEIGLPQLAETLGRSKANVCRKARFLGLTDNRRKAVSQRNDRRMFAGDTAALKVHRSEVMKARLARNGHPRGMVGKHHSPATKAKLAEASSKAQAAVSEDDRAVRIEKMLRKTLERHGHIAPQRPNASWKAGWREFGGKRNYYRSRWEANYARYLEWLKACGEIQEWQHEPETFWFEGIKRGVRSYLPDFRVWENDGSSRLHEVKGWMDARSHTTLKRMAKYHSGETIILIREKDYNAIARTAGPMIEGWEHSGRKGRL